VSAELPAASRRCPGRDSPWGYQSNYMGQIIFFILGLVSNVYMVAIFLIRRKNDSVTLRRVGRWYFILAIPAIINLFLFKNDDQFIRYGIFLGIFLAFLLVEWIYDFRLQFDWRRNWKLLTPYLALYYAANYGFIVMPWKIEHRAWQGIVMLIAVVIQIAVNLATHGPWSTRQKDQAAKY
jgi:hypothetical protein